MIQRIQSLFLLLAAGSVSLMAIFPFLQSNEVIQGSSLFQDQQFNWEDHIALIIIFGVAGAIALITIFLFRNRPLQMSLSKLIQFIILGGLGYAGYLWWEDFGLELPQATLMPQIGLLTPVLMSLLVMLAHRGIRKDEKKVRSSDRLR